MNDIYKNILKKDSKLKSKQINDLVLKISEYSESDELFYEILGLLNEGFSFNNIIKNINKNNFSWNNSFYKKFAEKRDYKDNMLSKPPEIKDGETECPKCLAKKTLIVEMQTRSADEGFTYFLHCLNPNCKKITKV